MVTGWHQSQLVGIFPAGITCCADDLHKFASLTFFTRISAMDKTERAMRKEEQERHDSETMKCEAAFRIRNSTPEDIDIIMPIYDRARKFMSEHGNPGQWTGGYPSRELIIAEIEASHSFICEDRDGNVAGTFCFIIGEDPTYSLIENGRWLSDRQYGTIHRLASAGTAKGVADACIGWCWQKIHNLRADTHADNTVMQAILDHSGFRRCGTIYTDDGSPRIAYQKIR